LYTTEYFVHHRIVSALKKAEFVTDRMSYIDLRGHWCNIIVLNVLAPSEGKSDDSKDSFYEELQQVFKLLPKYHTKIPLGDFNVKLRREDIFKLTIGNDSLHQDGDDKGVRIINLDT
jgi:exonuclease III